MVVTITLSTYVILYYYNIIQSAGRTENGQLIWNTVQLFYILNYYCYVCFFLLIFFFIFLLLFIIQFVYSLCGNITRLCPRASLWIMCVSVVRRRRRARSRYRTHMITRGKTDSLQGRITLYYYCCFCLVAFHSVIGSWNNASFKFCKYSRILAKLLRSHLLLSVCL